MGTYFSRFRSGRPAQPTTGSGDLLSQGRNDIYVQELADIQEYLSNLEKLLSGNTDSVHEASLALDLDEETLSSYLTALSMKADQLSGIKHYLRGSLNAQDPGLLPTLLDDVERRSRKMQNLLVSLQSRLTADNENRKLQNRPPVIPANQHAVLAQESEDESLQPQSCRSSLETPADSATVSNLHVPNDDAIPSTSQVIYDRASTSSSDSCDLEEESEEESENETTGILGNGMDLFDSWIKNVKTEKIIKFNIDRRRNILDDVIPMYQAMKTKNLTYKTYVEFVGEKGQDMGALTKEFFFMVFEAVGNGTYKGHRLMEGQRGHLIPNPMMDHRFFFCLGRIIVHAVINDCHGLAGLSPAIVHYLVNGTSIIDLEESHLPISIDDVADPELKQLLQKLDDRSNLTEDEEESLVTWMTNCNCAANWKSSSQLVLQELLLFYVFNKRIRQIQALAEGLNTLKFHEVLINASRLSLTHPERQIVSTIFPSTEDLTYTAELVMAVVVTRGDTFDDVVFTNFKQFVNNLGSEKIAGFSLSSLIQFVTSTPYLPDRLLVSFDSFITVPVAHVCFNEITLPLDHQTYEKFQESMLTAFSNGLTGFQLD